MWDLGGIVGDPSQLDALLDRLVLAEQQSNGPLTPDLAAQFRSRLVPLLERQLVRV